MGDSYVLLTRPTPQMATMELRFQFRYAAAQPPRLLQLNPQTLWFVRLNRGRRFTAPPVYGRGVGVFDPDARVPRER